MTVSERKTIPLSILDLAPIPQGALPREAFQRSLALAQQAETLGFQRYWLAEHHNMTGIASAATSVLISYLAAHTHRLRLGAGGIMLPNHPPLVIAEQFGTLESLYPHRIDLGLGRAPGSDQRTMLALRRNPAADLEDTFPDEVASLINWFDAVDHKPPSVQPVPGFGIKIPVWLLGSSLYSARLAAKMGLPFAFAAHFAPGLLNQALRAYRDQFQPSSRLDKPKVIVCINIVAADSEREAHFLFTSMQQQFLDLYRGHPGQLPAPVEDLHKIWSPAEQYGVQQALNMSLVGNIDRIRHGLTTLLRETQADEIMVNGQIFDNQARLHSFALTMEAARSV